SRDRALKGTYHAFIEGPEDPDLIGQGDSENHQGDADGGCGEIASRAGCG
ncbi:MAG: hypothetical protein RLZZ496_1328, partial [Pseudomonadota bacterium]